MTGALRLITYLGKLKIVNTWALEDMAGIGNRRLYKDEVKKDFTLKLTPSAAVKLTEMAKTINTSRSQLIERFARGEISGDVYSSLLGEWLINS